MVDVAVPTDGNIRKKENKELETMVQVMIGQSSNLQRGGVPTAHPWKKKISLSVLGTSKTRRAPEHQVEDPSLVEKPPLEGEKRIIFFIF